MTDPEPIQPFTIDPRLALDRLVCTRRRSMTIGPMFAVLIVVVALVVVADLLPEWKRGAYVLLSGILPVAIAAAWRASQRKVWSAAFIESHDRMLCPGCFYDLRGTPSAMTCPECSLSLTDNPPRAFWSAALVRRIDAGRARDSDNEGKPWKRRRRRRVDNGPADTARSLSRLVRSRRLIGLPVQLLIALVAFGLSLLAVWFAGLADPVVRLFLAISFGFGAAIVLAAIGRRADEHAIHDLIARNRLLCTRCLYDLNNLPENGRCPECGGEYNADATRWHWTCVIDLFELKGSRNKNQS